MMLILGPPEKASLTTKQHQVLYGISMVINLHLVECLLLKARILKKTKGFPNLWGWGIEDNLINDRCLAAGLTIDRSQFYDIKDKCIARSFDGFQRVISRKDSLAYKASDM